MDHILCSTSSAHFCTVISIWFGWLSKSIDESRSGAKERKNTSRNKENYRVIILSIVQLIILSSELLYLHVWARKGAIISDIYWNYLNFLLDTPINSELVNNNRSIACTNSNSSSSRSSNGIILCSLSYCRRIIIVCFAVLQLQAFQRILRLYSLLMFAFLLFCSYLLCWL